MFIEILQCLKTLIPIINFIYYALGIALLEQIMLRRRAAPMHIMYGQVLPVLCILLLMTEGLMFFNYRLTVWLLRKTVCTQVHTVIVVDVFIIDFGDCHRRTCGGSQTKLIWKKLCFFLSLPLYYMLTTCEVNGKPGNMEC